MSAEDELAIRSLIATYSDAVICRDGVAAAAVYADDGVLEAFGGAPLAGREAIENALARRLSSGAGFSYQLMQVVYVEVRGDTARARSHYFELSGPADGDTGRLSTGTARDRFVRTDQGWRISHRTLTRSYVGDMAAPGKSWPVPFGAWAAGRDEI